MRSSLARALTSTALTVGMLTAGAGAAAAAETHTVERGDTLADIAASYDSVGSWRQLADANADIVPNPNLIRVGQKLTLPGTGSSTTTSSSEPASSEPATSHSGNVSLETWDRLAECESNQTWDINTGNSFYGGLQFNKMSWDWAVDVGGHDVPSYPHNATRMEQIEVAETLLEIHPAGWRAWPACTRKLGIG
jgi:LysM repeat protein